MKNQLTRKAQAMPQIKNFSLLVAILFFTLSLSQAKAQSSPFEGYAKSQIGDIPPLTKEAIQTNEVNNNAATRANAEMNTGDTDAAYATTPTAGSCDSNCEPCQRTAYCISLRRGDVFIDTRLNATQTSSPKESGNSK